MTDAQLPTGDIDLLLRAALAPPDEAARALHEWRESTRLDDIPLLHQHLLPLLHQNLLPLLRGRLADNSTDDSADPAFARRVAGVYRYHWTRAQLRMRHGREAVHALVATGLDVCLDGPVVRALRHYASPAQRPFAYIDVWLEQDAIEPAAACLAPVGFAAVGARGQLEPRGRFTTTVLRHATGTALRIYAATERGPDSAPAQRTPFDWDGVEVPASDCATLLAQSLVAATPADDAPLMHWAADAWAVLRLARPGLDLARVHEHAARNGGSHRAAARLLWIETALRVGSQPAPTALRAAPTDR